MKKFLPFITGICFLGSVVLLCLGVYFFATTPPTYNKGSVSQNIEQRGKDSYLVTRTQRDTITANSSDKGIMCFVGMFGLVLVGFMAASTMQSEKK